MRRASVLALVFVAFVAGCSAETSSSEPAPDPTPADPPAVAHEAPSPKPWQSRGAPAACTTLPLTAQPIPMLEVPGEAPLATGGLVTVGTYDLTRDMVYMGDVVTVRRLPQEFAQTVRFWADGRIEVATRDGAQMTFAVGRWKASGTKLLSMEECPEAGHFGEPSYTATDGELTVQYGDEVLVYTKR
ncbi:MAG TPA: hypothetical protein VIF62_23660 [Labilithrix sp.]|jgi:hypothetical protein